MKRNLNYKKCTNHSVAVKNFEQLESTDMNPSKEKMIEIYHFKYYLDYTLKLKKLICDDTWLQHPFRNIEKSFRCIVWLSQDKEQSTKRYYMEGIFDSNHNQEIKLKFTHTLLQFSKSYFGINGAINDNIIFSKIKINSNIFSLYNTKFRNTQSIIRQKITQTKLTSQFNNVIQNLLNFNESFKNECCNRAQNNKSDFEDTLRRQDLYKQLSNILPPGYENMIPKYCLTRKYRQLDKVNENQNLQYQDQALINISIHDNQILKLKEYLKYSSKHDSFYNRVNDYYIKTLSKVYDRAENEVRRLLPQSSKFGPTKKRMHEHKMKEMKNCDGFISLQDFDETFSNIVIKPQLSTVARKNIQNLINQGKFIPTKSKFLMSQPKFFKELLSNCKSIPKLSKNNTKIFNVVHEIESVSSRRLTDFYSVKPYECDTSSINPLTITLNCVRTSIVPDTFMTRKDLIISNHKLHNIKSLPWLHKKDKSHPESLHISIENENEMNNTFIYKVNKEKLESEYIETLSRYHDIEQQITTLQIKQHINDVRTTTKSIEENTFYTLPSENNVISIDMDSVTDSVIKSPKILDIDLEMDLNSISSTFQFRRVSTDSSSGYIHYEDA